MGFRLAVVLDPMDEDVGVGPPVRGARPPFLAVGSDEADHDRDAAHRPLRDVRRLLHVEYRPRHPSSVEHTFGLVQGVLVGQARKERDVDEVTLGPAGVDIDVEGLAILEMRSGIEPDWIGGQHPHLVPGGVMNVDLQAER